MTVGPDNTCVWAQFTVLVTQREQVIAQLKEAGIPTAVHYPRPIHLQPAYTQYAKTGELPVSEDLARRVLSLPMHPDLDESTEGGRVGKEWGGKCSSRGWERT